MSSNYLFRNSLRKDADLAGVYQLNSCINLSKAVRNSANSVSNLVTLSSNPLELPVGASSAKSMADRSGAPDNKCAYLTSFWPGRLV